MKRFLLISLCVFASLRDRSSAGDNWPQFRGEQAGVAEGKNLPTTWDTKKNVAWVVDVPGRGWSSPVVWGKKIFLTTVDRKGGFEEAKKGLYFGGDRSKAADEEQRWLVLCFDLDSGKLVWEREPARGKPKTPVHVKNSYASETPVTDGERLYVYFGGVGLWCYDLDGKELWKKAFDPVSTRFNWGTGASPALADGRLFIVNDNEKNSYLLCLDAKTGDEHWLVSRDEKSNWSTPFIWKNDKRTEVVTTGSKKARSYDFEGKLLWELGPMSSVTIPTPFSRHELLYVGSGFVMDGKRPIYAVKPGAEGDISPKEDEPQSQFLAWRQKQIAPYNPSFLVYGDYLYVLYDRGMFACFDAKTGNEVYEKQRLEAQFTASPWAYDGKIFCLSEDGDTYVIQAGREFKQLGKNRLDEMCMATPAIVGDSLLIRTLTKLYRIKEGAGARE
jgi:outer membrane protein assembly factor BamB